MILDVDGRRAYAYTGGRRFDASLPLVVFVHGAQNDHSVWGLQSRSFAHHGFAVLAVDLPGHGRSEGPPLATVEAMAAWILAVVAAAGCSRAAIVGHSMGSLVAIEAAAQSLAPGAPARVDRIVPIATAYPMQVSAALLDATAHDEPRAIAMVSIWASDVAHGGFSQKPSAPGPGFGVVWGNRRLMERQPPGTMHVDFAACHAYRRGDDAAAAVECPALFVVAARDAMTQPKSAKAFAARFRDARVVEVPASGHTVMSEAPDAVLDALSAFLAPPR